MKQILQETFEKHIKLVQNHFNLNENDLKSLMIENTPQQNFKMLVISNKLSKEDAIKIKNIDPHPKKAYSYWIAKQYLDNNVKLDDDDLQDTVKSFYDLVKKQKITGSEVDIQKYAEDFNDLKKKLDQLKDEGKDISKTDLENDVEIIADNEDVYIGVPHTHEASRKLGLSKFACKINSQTGRKESTWCTTYDNPKNWNDYYYKQNVTFYYIHVKSEELYDNLKNAGFGAKEFKHVAVAVYDREYKLDDETHRMEAYDSKNKMFKGAELNKYLETIVKYV